MNDKHCSIALQIKEKGYIDQFSDLKFKKRQIDRDTLCNRNYIIL